MSILWTVFCGVVYFFAMRERVAEIGKSKIRRVWRRLFVVVCLHFAAFEILMRLAVDWKESTGEIALMAETVSCFAGGIWCFLPVYRGLRHRGQVLAIASATIAVLSLNLSLGAATYYYSWHVRPNIGFYEEPIWVAQHPGFQRQLRARIQSNMWTKKDEE